MDGDPFATGAITAVAPIRALLIDNDHRLWIEIHTTDRSRRYLLLNPAGHVEGYVDLPESEAVAAAAGNVTWTVEADADGLHSLVSRRLVTAAPTR